MSAIRDIPDQKAEEKFRNLLDSAPDAIVIMSREGSILLVNSQTEKLFGYSRDELLGRRVENLLPGHYQASRGKHRDSYFTNPRIRVSAGFELLGRRKDATEFPVEISLRPFETEDGVLISNWIRDITERKRFDQTLQESNIQLSRSNSKLEATNMGLQASPIRFHTTCGRLLGGSQSAAARQREVKGRSLENPTDAQRT